MSAIIISIVIPTCNRQLGALRAVESALGQKLDGAFEILVIDDGISEQSLAHKTLQKYIHNGQIKYLQNKGPHGAAFARNFGVAHAQGKYITFLDDDDCYLPGRIQNMLNTMITEKYVFVSSTRFHESFDFRQIKNWPNQLSGIITLYDIQFINDIDIGFIVKREDFLKLGGFDTNFYNLEDWDFLIRILQLGDGFKLDRQDYAENVNPDRARNSDNGHISYRQLADKHRSIFGGRWYGIMLAIADQTQGIFTLQKALRYAARFHTMTPINIYLKKLFNNLK